METRGNANKVQAKIMFKSYYVVWKPISHVENTDYIKSLNRTMQYGNPKQQQIRTRVYKV